MKSSEQAPASRGTRPAVRRKVAALTATLYPCEEGGFTAICNEIKGAVSQGETRKEALANLLDAVKAIWEVTAEMTAAKSRAHTLKSGKSGRPIKSKLMELCEAC